MAPALKRRRVDQVEEITFDPTARQEYLTGFHKRKQQRIQNAKDAIAKREKEERVQERRQLREQRKVDLENHIAEINSELKKQDPDRSDAGSSTEEVKEEDEWEGVEEVAQVVPVAEDEEYVDEDKYTTVTVEAMEAFEAASPSGDEPSTKLHEDKDLEGKAKPVKKRAWTKDGKNVKTKKKKFRYESKAERQLTRQKQKSKNHAAKVRRTGK